MENNMTEQEMKTNFTRRLRVLMRRKHIKQRELAELSGLSENTISYYITGERLPRLDAAHKLAEALDCDLNDLISE